jgi:hypothetical protein
MPSIELLPLFSSDHQRPASWLVDLPSTRTVKTPFTKLQAVWAPSVALTIAGLSRVKLQ